MDMAAEMDITRRTVQHWENGESEPTVSQLMAWIRTAGENPVPYLIALAYPDSDIIDGCIRHSGTAWEALSILWPTMN